ncbi:MAG TPA: DUF5020 family protein [Salinivirga sp.]|uniref:DUF5020 family protein n=1 Tax=Salinivirga sp. TaxID=1970192 RepID=UPI002B489A33|nr:DUF5020 family protein [Salinivirga sp.]HKK59853.1 DUF5020 family protein [Salinivirga sp.]
MKKILLLSVSLFSLAVLSGQNLQLHYDFTDANSENIKGRNYMTATFEMFKPDSVGSTFWFIDIDFSGPHSEPALAYVEFMRDLKFWDFPVALHAEYNGGLIHNIDNSNFGSPLEHIGIVGPSAAFSFAGIGFSTYAGFRFGHKPEEGPDFQWTFTWFKNLADNKISLTGFFDIWTQDDYNAPAQPDGKKLVIITEPQIWYNIAPWLSAGGEIEISHNFIPGSKKLEVFPTLGAKYTF